MTTLTVDPEGVVVALRPGETVLECLYRHGYAYRIGCRRGGCAVCKVDIVSGEVDYSHTIAAKVLSEEERDAGVCLTCRAVPRSDLVIALRDEELRIVNPILARMACSTGTPN